MNYYTLLKQYIATGLSLTGYQLSKISRDRSLLNSYFRARGRYLEQTRNLLKPYEIGFLIENPDYFAKFSKSDLMRVFYNAEKIYIKGLAKNIIRIYGSELTIYERDKIIERSNDGDIIGLLYKINPEYYETDYWKVRLIHFGILDRSVLDTVVKVSFSFKELPGLLNIDRSVISDILKNNAKKYCSGVSGISYYPQMTLEYDVYEDNKKKIIEVFLKRYPDMELSDVDRNVLMSIFYDIKFKDVLEAMRNSFVKSIPENCAEMLYNTLRDSLSYYGEVKSLNSDGAVLVVDISKFDIAGIKFKCGHYNLECFFKESIGITIQEPIIHLPEIDEDKFNKSLSIKLDELLNKP
jgi:hypothetical protein